MATTVTVIGHYPPSIDGANAQTNPAQVISPACNHTGILELPAISL